MNANTDAHSVLRFERSWGYVCSDVIKFLKSLPDGCVHCIITSPPYYGLRDYKVDGQIGLEGSPQQFIAKLVEVFDECRRVIHQSGTLWLNIGDSYCTGPKNRTHDSSMSTLQGSQKTQEASRRQPSKIHDGWKPKDMLGMPWRLAFALQDAGWYLRSDIVWAKKNSMPESVSDRPSKSHEYIFMLAKSKKYFYDIDAVRQKLKPSSVARLGQDVNNQKGSDRIEGKKNGNMKAVGSGDGAALRTVWHMSVGRSSVKHFATYPRHLVRPCVRAGTSGKGCCPTCLEPWVRIVEKIRRPTRPGTNSKIHGGKNGWMNVDRDIRHDNGGETGAVIGNRDPRRHVTERILRGWKQNCKCESAEPVPCLVLDPFLGSGTTIAVAVEEGRRGVGCELNPEYCRIIDDTMSAVQPHLFGSA